jgi:uncharacterized protein (TIGR02271 family)
MDERERETHASEDSLVRHDERLEIGRTPREVGAIRARKRVVSDEVDEEVPRSVEHFDDVERTGPREDDSGEVEILPDGSVSIPILEEELVISKRTVVRERVIVRKRTETTRERVETELRREKLDVDTEGDVELVDDTG